MASNIKCADIGKLVQFESDSKAAKAEFNRIQRRFKEINDELLKKWQGAGADQYKKEVDSNIEKIGNVSEVLDAINDGVLKNVKDAYLQLDEELGKFNLNPTTEDDKK